jgi:hypothetical protein
VTVQQQIKIFYDKSPQGGKWRFQGSPFAVVSIIFILIWLFLVVKTATKLTGDYYYPYEGRVLRIETRWYDHIPFDFMTWEHLVIETPEGEIIDRLVSMEIRFSNHIQPGDYVIKSKGFRNAVRPRDKKTTQELLE